MTVASCLRPLFVLAAVSVAMSAGAVHALASQTAPGAPPDVTAVGCVFQQPDTAAAPPTSHEQGAATGLSITRATLKSKDGRSPGAPPRSAVPGSVPAGSGSGTTAERATPTGASATIEQSLWLVGAKAAELTRFVGQRVEVVGTIDARLDANPGTARVTDAGAAAARRSSTAPPEPPATAHPSAPTRALAVTSFRVLGEACR